MHLLEETIASVSVLLIILTGCIIQSFHPFYTDKSKIALPQLNGDWDLVRAWGETAEQGSGPWRIHDDKIKTIDDKGLTAMIHVTFFKVGDRLFCDSIEGEQRHRWGSAKLYRAYYQDYRTFLARPEEVGPYGGGREVHQFAHLRRCVATG